MILHDPIQRVAVVTTGHVQIRPDHEASSWRPTAWWLLTSGRFEIEPEETLSAGLDRLGKAATDVGTAVISHFHQDHIGALAELSGADIVVSEAGWKTLSRPLPEMRGLMTRHIDLPGLHVPGVGSRRRLRAATALVNQMRKQHPDLVVLPAHDPGTAARLAHATADDRVVGASV
jgi:glyoxylase-like metal-dependent hydrolase (beta-lactamase superfamily II)